MEEVIKKHYTGNAAEQYVAGRKNNPKWLAEQKVVEDFVYANHDVSTVIDAPLGTNRYGAFLESQPHIKKVLGYELSDDMIKVAEKGVSSKLEIHKHDLVNDAIKEKADLLINMRMLNLFDENTSTKILNNILCATKKYCILSLRHWLNEPTYIENKIWIQNLATIQGIISIAGFDIINETKIEDSRSGQYSIFTLEKNESIHNR